MAANPIPPQDHNEANERLESTHSRFPWGWVGAIITIICLVLIAYFFFVR